MTDKCCHKQANHCKLAIRKDEQLTVDHICYDAKGFVLSVGRIGQIRCNSNR